MPDVALAEKRNVGSSTLPLTTSSEQAIRPMTCQNMAFKDRAVVAIRARLRPLRTAVRHRMLHADCTAHGSGVTVFGPRLVRRALRSLEFELGL